MAANLTNQEQALYDILLTKSQEAFIVAIELFNRPTLNYRVEGCAMFLCNAWELMLKAHLLQTKGNTEIYQKDNPSRSISLNQCLLKIYPNENDPLRKNFEEIISLRNTSTHFVTTEYEISHGPFLQACVNNYWEQLKTLHNIDISNKIPENYLILSVRRDVLSPQTIHAKYTPEVAERLINSLARIEESMCEVDNYRYAAKYETNLLITKRKEQADLVVSIDRNADTTVAKVKEVSNPIDKYPYTRKLAIEEINRRLGLPNNDSPYEYAGSKINKFTTYHWKLFIDAYQMKEDLRFCYDTSHPNIKTRSYTFSREAIEHVIGEMRLHPADCLNGLKSRLSRKQA